MRVGLVTLGCDKNTVDNEYLAGLLGKAGCEIAPAVDLDAPEPLDAVVVTTCGFIGTAKQQSVDTIVALADHKRTTGNPGKLFVAGCLAQRYAGELLDEIPEIDGLVGVGQFNTIVDMIRAAAAERNAVLAVPRVDIYEFMSRPRLDARPHAFLKLSDGCDHACTFCSIPAMKGKLRSVPHGILLDEARALVAEGVREINLVAQDLADYGRDRWKDYRLPELLRDLARIDGDFWIRCFYLYPGGINDRLLEVLATEPKIVPYVDMPLQHLDFGVLRRMKRPYRDVNTFRLVEKMRSAVPGLALRTTMIVGFPGETDAEHQAMIDGMRALRFERLGAFQYSREEDTPAGVMGGQVPDEIKEARWRAVMETQAEISAAWNAARVGQVQRVLVESYDDGARRWNARGPAEAVDIDGAVFLESDHPLEIGQFVDAEILESDTYDLHAAALPAAARA